MIGGGWFLLFGLLLLAAARTHADNVTTYHEWADASVQSYLLRFWNMKAGYINAASPSSSGTITQYWNFAQGFDAVLDAVNRTDSLQYFGWMFTWLHAQNSTGWYRDWYDDDNWMALALLRAYYLASATQHPSAKDLLAPAILLYEAIAAEWDTSCCGAVKGGIWWDKQHTQKATASNAGPVILAARLYRQSGNKEYLSNALKWFTYWAENMVSSTYQIADHFNTDGTKVWWKFTYNSGLMVGAATELYLATGNKTYLALAHKYASFVLTDMTTPTKFGPVLTDGSSATCSGDCQEFKGPTFRYLAELYQVDPDNSKDIYNVLQASANAIWQIGRDPSRNLFSTDWAEPLASNAVVNDGQQNAATQALNVFARLAGPYPGTGYSSLRYEAENGELIKLGVDFANSGFTGWGYVVLPGVEGERLLIYFYVPTKDQYSISFRYASLEYVIRQTGIIYPQNDVGQFHFPSTGGYGNYQTVTFAAKPYNVGWCLLSVQYVAASSSSGSFHLDSITLVKSAAAATV